MKILRKLIAIILGVVGVLTVIVLWQPHLILAILLGLLTLDIVIEMIKKDHTRGFDWLAIIILLVSFYFIILK